MQLVPNIYNNKINTMPYHADGNYFNQNVVHENAGQLIVCNEQSVREFLEDYCVNTINLIIQEMQFFLNMTTCKITKKHLFTRQNRGEQKMQGIIDISYQQINTLALQIVIPMGKLSATQKQVVLHWMYDECDKLCNQFQLHRLARSDLFFEVMFKNCGEELKKREASQSFPAKPRKTTLNSYTTIDSKNFAAPPPPYTSPNSSYGAFQPNSYQPHTHFLAPMAPPPPPAQSYFTVKGISMASPFNVRSQQISTVTQSQELQRPMTAPVQTTTSRYSTNSGSPCVIYSGANRKRNLWLTQSTSSQNLDQSAMTMEALLENSYHQQAVSQKPMFGTVDANNGTQSNGEMIGNPDLQQIFIEDKSNIASQSDGQQTMLNNIGFAEMPIQRQTTQEFNTSSNGVQSPRKRAASTQLGESSASKLLRNALAQNDQQQTQYVMRYGEVLDDGLRTPIINMSLEPFEMTDLLHFNAAGSANHSENIEKQINDVSNELSTPTKPTARQSLIIDEIVNDELQLFNEVEMFELETSLNISETNEIQPAEVIIESTNAEQRDDDTAQPVVTPPEPMPSMPDLFDEQATAASIEQNAMKSTPETLYEHSNEKSPAEKSEKPNTEQSSPESSNETGTSKTTEDTSIDSVQSAPEIAIEEPSMPDLFDEQVTAASIEQNAMKSTPETSDEPSNEKSPAEKSEKPNTEQSSPESLNEIDTSKPTENTSIDSVQLAPEIASEEPCTSNLVMNTSIDPASEAHEQPAVESEDAVDNSPNVGSEADKDDDCEILVQTNTQLQPKIKKEDPLETDNSCDSENITGFVDLPSSMRKCNRYVDLTVDDDDDRDSDVLVIESDEEEPREQKFSKYQCVVCSQLAKLICVGCYCRTYCSDFCKESNDAEHIKGCSTVDVKDILRNQE